MAEIRHQPDKHAVFVVGAKRRVAFQAAAGGVWRGLPEAQFAGGFVVYVNAQQVAHKGVAGQEQGIALGFGQRSKRVQRVGLDDIKACGGGAAQGGEVGVSAELFGDVFGEGADVGAFAALHGDGGVRRGKILDGDLADGDVARFALDGDALAGVFVERFAVVFERGKHGGDLAYIARERGAGSLKLAQADVAAPCGDDVAFGIARGAGFAEFERGGVGFVGIQKVLGEFGGFAEANGQHAGGKRVQHAGVPCFFGAVEAAGLLQGGVAG